MVGLKNCHIRKNLTPKMVNPRDIARNAEEEEEEEEKEEEEEEEDIHVYSQRRRRRRSRRRIYSRILTEEKEKKKKKRKKKKKIIHVYSQRRRRRYSCILTDKLPPEQHDGVVPLLPHQPCRQTIFSAQVLVVHGCGAVPRVVISYTRVVPPGAADHQVRAVHGVQTWVKVTLR